MDRRRYLKQRFSDVRAIQISLNSKEDYITKDDIRVMPAVKFLNELV